MAFPRKLLYETEEVVLDLRPHWWYLAPRTLLLALTVALLVGLSAAGAADWVLLGLAVVVLVALGRFVVRYARWATTHMVLTTDRLIFRTGVLSKRGIEIPLERINTVFFSQRFFERLLGSGDLAIESAGERGVQHFSDVGHPSWVQSEIYRQVEDNQQRMVGGGRRAPEPSLAEQLTQLDDLRRRGILTDAEFQAKKAQLLQER